MKPGRWAVLCPSAAVLALGVLAVRSTSVGAVQIRPSAEIAIDYPQQSSIFPPEMTPPLFEWHDASTAAVWRVRIAFADGARAVEEQAAGEPPRVGEIDPRCIGPTNEIPTLTPEQKAAHTWRPSAATWAAVRQHAVERPAQVTIAGYADGSEISSATMQLSVSRDAVGAPIFYRDVPLMPAATQRGIVQPLAQSSLPLIQWRLRDISKAESRVVMTGLHTCGNCHSFSANGKTMGIDVDGPGNDKGLYALVPVQKQMRIETKDVIAWNADRSVGNARVGFMSQVSPDGRYVLSTFAGADQSIPSSYFVINFKDYRFLQVFYPTRGILAFYDRTTGRRQPLPGADDPGYVQTDGVWSPDGKWIVFVRAEAQDPDPPGHVMPEAANDPNEIQIRYSLYRVPFNGGRGGKAEPIAGAADNGMSNNFPKISPDGKWVVFVRCRNGQLMRPDSELYIVPLAGGRARRMRCNTSRMNSWHSFSPNGRWLVFSSKSLSPYTQMFLTHIDAKGNDSPPILIENATAANRAVNIPEFVNVAGDGIERIDVPAADLYRVIDEAMELQKKGDGAGALAKWKQALALDPNDARANNGLGIALGLAGRGEEAQAAFEKAVAADHESFEAWYNLGVLAMHMGRYEVAAEAWRNTVRLRPQFTHGRENLQKALENAGAVAH
ncbi:MAG TPA: tetratricopeptide repeat protein [Terracidiphilus sp.]|nr:tetratricopeptide repeat protein [Terracidiphilus sp.]